MATPTSHLDLRGTPCPLNYVRAKLALEPLAEGALLSVWLDEGEPRQMVCEGLRRGGHRVEACSRSDGSVALLIEKRGAHGLL